MLSLAKDKTQQSDDNAIKAEFDAISVSDPVGETQQPRLGPQKLPAREGLSSSSTTQLEQREEQTGNDRETQTSSSALAATLPGRDGQTQKTTTEETQDASSPSSSSSLSSSSSSPQQQQHAPDRPLILYAYFETTSSRPNLEFFIDHGLHASADFVFILNGDTDAPSIIPNATNIHYVRRPNRCYDLGSYAEVLLTDNLYKRYKRFIMLNSSIRGPFLPYWAEGCWSDMYLRRVTDEVKVGRARLSLFLLPLTPSAKHTYIGGTTYLANALSLFSSSA
jgi:hypothetical protein